MYFAAETDSEKLGQNVVKQVNRFYDYARGSEGWYRRELAWRFYYGYGKYGCRHESSAIGDGGERGELSIFKSNVLRTYARQWVNLMVAIKPTVVAMVNDTEPLTTLQADVARKWTQHASQRPDTMEILREAVEGACVQADTYTRVYWDNYAGLPAGMLDNSEIVYKGKLRRRVYAAHDVARPVWLPYADQQWRVLRTPINKYDAVAIWAANNPELEKNILAQPDIAYRNDTRHLMGEDIPTDYIWLNEFFHEWTPAVPGGVYLPFCQDGTPLTPASPLIGGRTHIHRMLIDQVLGTGEAYTQMFDMTALQEGLDTLNSAIMTNQEISVIGAIARTPRTRMIGSEYGGMSTYVADTAEDFPKVLQLAQTPAESFTFREVLMEDLQRISTLNDAAVGNPGKNVRSASQQAQMRASVYEANSGPAHNLRQFVLGLMQSDLQLSHIHGEQEEMQRVLGTDLYNQVAMAGFDEVFAFDRISLEYNNQLSSDIMGRLMLADAMKQAQGGISPQQFWNVQETGNLEGARRPATALPFALEQKIELIRQGIPVPVQDDDQHAETIARLTTFIAETPDTNAKQLAQQIKLEHVARWEMLSIQRPSLLIATGQQPLPVPPPMPMMEGPGPVSAGKPPGPAPAPKGADARSPAPPVTAPIQETNLDVGGRVVGRPSGG